MSDEKKLDGELKEGAAAQGERELGVDAQAAGDPRGERLRASSAGDDKVLRMGTASIPRLITEFAIPSVVGMLINGSYAIIDSVFLGHVVGEIGLSAMTVANPIMIVFMAIAMLIGNGANLSQGQRQLLAIARAAVADPPVMILDEATSSIDTRTEAIVQQGMDSLMYGRTVFVIAHRLSTVRNSNAIMVLDHGRIVERGDHDDLIRQHGLYYQLYTGAFELE